MQPNLFSKFSTAWIWRAFS